MARYKYIDTNPKFLAIDLAQQLLPGTFEHALHHLLEHEIDLTRFDARFRNDDTGAPAYPPAVLLKVVLFAYARGIVSSRAIARACTEHVTFIALCGDQAPHFTTIAHFVSTVGDEIAHVFAAVVAICDRQGLIGREMFAIDGVKLPCNASKQRSGTRAEFVRQADKLEAAARVIVQRHRATDALPVEPDLETKAIARVTQLQQDAADLRTWITAHPDERRGPKGTVRQSNRTDNDSAKMATSKGVIQGYTGVAAVDDRAQIVVVAQAHGTGSEHELLEPVVDALMPVLAPTSLLTADAGYHSTAACQLLEARGIDALLADGQLRQRDERFATQDRHQQAPHPLHDKTRARVPTPPTPTATPFAPRDFTYDPIARTCVCPAGNALYRKGASRIVHGYVSEQFRGTVRDCVSCALRAQCLRTPDTTRVRNVAFIRERVQPKPETASTRMRARIDTPEGRARYGRRFATVEPVFANLRHNKRLTRFTVRGRAKVNAQWQLFCLVHNIEKLAHHGYAA